MDGEGGDRVVLEGEGGGQTKVEEYVFKLKNGAKIDCWGV